MEVHHHSHHPKKWKEYISEFLMLFLAVSLGFLAENVREEQIIEHQTESVLAQLRVELMQDTAQFSNNKKTIAKLDSAVAFVPILLKTINLKLRPKNFIYYIITSCFVLVFLNLFVLL